MQQSGKGGKNIPTPNISKEYVWRNGRLVSLKATGRGTSNNAATERGGTFSVDGVQYRQTTDAITKVRKK
jgi:hypothetical protein